MFISHLSSLFYLSVCLSVSLSHSLFLSLSLLPSISNCLPLSRLLSHSVSLSYLLSLPSSYLFVFSSLARSPFYPSPILLSHSEMRRKKFGEKSFKLTHVHHLLSELAGGLFTLNFFRFNHSNPGPGLQTFLRL
jgi:hypothetical protein